MVETVATLKEKWHALQLELLVPVRLSDEDFTAVLAARADPGSRAFREHLPLTVARYKKRAQRAVLAAAHDAPAVTSSPPHREIYLHDTSQINQALFGFATYKPEAAVGPFMKTRAGMLHRDGASDFKTVYLARIGALPVWAISGRHEFKSESLALIDAAKERGSPAREAGLMALRRRRILRAVPLGDVVLLLGNKKAGTLHCSCPVPPGGVYSGFCRSFGGIGNG